MKTPPDNFDSIIDQFEAQWRSGSSPAIAEYLSQVSEQQKPSLAKLLLPIDIEYRVKRGDKVSVADYERLGREVLPFVQNAIVSQLAQHVEASDATKTHEPDNRERKSQVIGNYKLLQKLGEGGMGTVWMAEQERPVRRRVALKLIKAGHDSKEVVARFEAERQALAMMDHHNIAKVLDGGTTDSGQPYFVMELVQGIPFNKYCDQHKLSINERLDLFVPICNAVQHAHQKGIIHRDLKPSNILVSLYDGKPVPKVIDFGLAKALQHQSKLTDKTLFTEFGQVVGTLQYMSPEQAEMNQLDVDTRTDVYSLGVILYELLNGSTPIDAETLKNQAILKVLESIREKEPPRPSARLSSASNEAVSGISLQRQIDPGKLKNILRGELDWIVMKALEKDRSRRYETASGFAEDIGRYLGGESVLACPPSIAYKLRKVYRRNRVAVWVSAIIMTALLVGITGTSLALVEAKRVRDINANLDTELRAAIRQFDIQMTPGHWKSLAPEPSMYISELRSGVLGVLDRRLTAFGVAEISYELFTQQAADEVVREGSMLPAIKDQFIRIAVTFPQSRFCYLVALNPTNDPEWNVQFCYPENANQPPSQLSALSYPNNQTSYFPLTDGVGQQVILVLSSNTPLPAFENFRRQYEKQLQWEPNACIGVWGFSKGKVNAIRESPKGSKPEQFEKHMKALQKVMEPIGIQVDAVAFSVSR